MSPVVVKYWLFQVPGMVLIAFLGVCAWKWLELPAWAVAALLAANFLKDLVLFPFVRKSYEVSSAPVVERLVGATGVAKERLAPKGYVHVAGELWRAELRGGGEVAEGTLVRVVAASGLTLVVESAEDPPKV